MTGHSKSHAAGRARQVPVVALEAVSRHFGTNGSQVTALDGVSLDIRRGEFVALSGPSPSGKSTLINCGSGLEPVCTGAVRVAGTSLESLSDTERTALRAETMGFLFPTPHLLPGMTVIENVEFPLVTAGVARDEARERAAEALEVVGLSGIAAHKPAHVSEGQAQRITVARALVNRPTVLWADNPARGLDPRATAELAHLFERISEDLGIACVAATNDHTMANRSGRLVHMRDGRIIGEERCR